MDGDGDILTSVPARALSNFWLFMHGGIAPQSGGLYEPLPDGLLSIDAFIAQVQSHSGPS